MHCDKDSLTARDVLEMEHPEMHKETKCWIKETAQSCSTVVVLVAAVVCAAVYSIPGGTKKGIRVFLGSPVFYIFTVTDVMAFTSSLASVVTLLSNLTSPFELWDFHKSLPQNSTWDLHFCSSHWCAQRWHSTQPFFSLLRLRTRTGLQFCVKALPSFLPQRTDNDIKNYWNTHLKKKLKKFQAALDPHLASDSTTTGQYLSKSFNDRRSLDISNNHASPLRLSQSQSSSSTYASSTENISRLLEGWMRSSPNPLKGTQEDELQSNDNFENSKLVKYSSVPALNLHLHHKTKDEQEGGDLMSHEEFDSILSFENLNNAAWDKSTCDSMREKGSEAATESADKGHDIEEKIRQKSENSAPPMSFLEKWLLDENVGQVEDMMEFSPMF